MSKVAKVLGTVSSVVSTVFALTGNPVMAAAFAANAALMSTVAAATATKPPARGSTTNVILAANAPMPYTMGRTYIGGNRIHEVGYGATLKKVKNPYRTQVDIWSCAGPVEQIEAFQSDFTTISFSGGNAVGYYNGFMYLSTQLGNAPEAGALAGPFGAIPGWGAAHKLSGFAAGLSTLKFDREGKKLASGVPQFGAILRGVKVYDPRQDSTYPGGSGTCRALQEATYVGFPAAENPGCHGLTYALGRYQNGKKVFGCGFAPDSIDWPAWVAFANACDANAWKVGGTIYEPGSKWDNLKRICEAGGGVPVFVGAKLSVRFNSPKVALDTITADDLADGEYVVPAMKSWRDRKNSIVPRYRSEAHKWEYVQSDAVTIASYVTEDGEEKQEERQYDLVQHRDQAAQLAAYDLVNGREVGPITLSCKPRMIEYRPGEALNVDVEELGLVNRLCIITGRRLDPGTGIVELTLETETSSKHAFALGRTGTAPPTPSISTGEEMDEVVGENAVSVALVTNLISTSSVTDADPADGLLQATNTAITIEAHTRSYSDKTVNVTGGSLPVVAPTGSYNHVYYDDPSRAGGNVVFYATIDAAVAATSAANPDRHYVGSVITDVAGGTGTSGGGATPSGWDRETYYNQTP